MSRAAIKRELVGPVAKELKMPGLLRGYEQLARQAREEQWSHEEYLFEALSIEQLSRRDSAIRQRIHDAHFPEQKTLDTFDFAATGGTIAPAQISDLARGDWLTRGDNVIFAGPIGTGKTHLASWRRAALQRRGRTLREAQRAHHHQPRVRRVGEGLRWR